MRRRHHPVKGEKVAHRAHGGGVSHHPHNAVKVAAGEGHSGHLHAARRARGGTCWYCGDKFGKAKKREDGGKVDDTMGTGDHMMVSQPDPTNDHMKADTSAGQDPMTKGLTPKARGGGIHIKPSHKGLLHKDLGVPSDKPIPAKKLAKAEHSSSPAVRKRAIFAENQKKWHH